MDRRALEFLADRTRQRAGLAANDFADAVEIVVRIVGPMAIVYDAGLSSDPLLGEQAYLRRRRDGAFEIVIRPDARDLRFRLLHEVAHVVMLEAKMRLSLRDEESAANYIAAANMAPPELLRRAHAYYGEDETLAPIAETFGMSQTATHLRLGEVLGDERAIVTRHENVFVRSQGAFPWDEVPVLDIAGGRTEWRGLAKTVLRGGIDEGRIALRAK